MTISDDLDDKNEHLLLLKDKINSYLAFIENGQLTESYTDKDYKKITIQIVFKDQPKSTSHEFLTVAERLLNDKCPIFFYTLEA